MLNATLKERIKQNYENIALKGNTDTCCHPQEICNIKIYNISNSNEKTSSSSVLGYHANELKSIPEDSILGLGCGAPLNFANLKKDETVVDLGSGAGIDVFLAAKAVGDRGKVIGIDISEEMLKKARKIAIENNYSNVEFRNGDIEEKIPVKDNSIDVVTSNCVINLTSNKTNTFKEIYRILKKNGKGRMIISDLITTREISDDSINTESWCNCIDGALTKDNYIQSIKEAGFQDIQILNEKIYTDENHLGDGRKIFSITVKAVTRQVKL